MASTNRVNDKIDEILKELKDLKDKYERLRDSRETDKEDMKLQIEKCKLDLRKQMNNFFKKLEKKFLNEITDFEEKMTKEIDNHVTKSDDALIVINDKIKSLEGCKKSKNDDAISDEEKKSKSMKSKYEKELCKIEQEMSTILIDFEPTDDITDLLKKFKSLGTIQTKKKHIDVGSRDVFDSTCIGDSYLVLACGGDGLKLLDKHFNVQSQLDVEAYRVAAINNHEVVITQCQKQIQRVSISPEMVMANTETLEMDRKCFGVCVHHKDIYVTCHNDPGRGEVRVVDMTGITKRSLGFRGERCIFHRPEYVTVSEDETMVFVSDVDSKKVTCLSQDDHVLYEYADNMLQSPRGMYVHDQSTLLACDDDSHVIHEIKKNGRMQRIIDPLSKKDGVLQPYCISRRPHDGYMVVGLSGAEKALVVLQVK